MSKNDETTARASYIGTIYKYCNETSSLNFDNFPTRSLKVYAETLIAHPEDAEIVWIKMSDEFTEIMLDRARSSGFAGLKSYAAPELQHQIGKALVTGKLFKTMELENKPKASPIILDKRIHQTLPSKAESQKGGKSTQVVIANNDHEVRITALHEGVLKLRRDLADLSNQVKQIKEAVGKDIPTKISSFLLKLLNVTYKKELAESQFNENVQGLIAEYAGFPQPILEEPTLHTLYDKMRSMEVRMQFLMNFANGQNLNTKIISRSRTRAWRKKRGFRWSRSKKGQKNPAHDEEHKWEQILYLCFFCLVLFQGKHIFAGICHLNSKPIKWRFEQLISQVINFIYLIQFDA